MRIQSERGGVLFCTIVLLLVAGLTAFTACYTYPETLDLAGAAMLCALAALLAFAAAIMFVSCGRTLEMRAEGCIVSLGRVRRFYRWDAFAVMRRERYQFSMVRPAVYDECVLFSLLEKPQKTCPSVFALRHPWACFTIHAKQDPKEVRWVRGYLNIYEVDLQILQEKLTEWGVAVEGLTDPPR